MAPFVRRSARAPTIKAVRGTVANQGIFNIKRALGSCYGDLFPLQASFYCLIVGLGPGLQLSGFGGVSKNIGPQLAYIVALKKRDQILAPVLVIILRVLWHFVGTLLPVLVFTGAAPRRFSTSSGKIQSLISGAFELGVATVWLADPNGLKWTCSGQNGRTWTIFFSRMPKSWFGTG